MSQTVLVAHSVTSTRDFIHDYLAAWGYLTVEVADEQGAAAALADQPEIIIAIVDADLPGAGASGLCNQLRQGDSQTYVYTIVVTSAKTPPGFSCEDADAIVDQPFDTRLLHAEIRLGTQLAEMRGLKLAARTSCGRDCPVDTVTGVASRAEIMTRLEGELDRARRMPAPVAAIQVHVDSPDVGSLTYDPAACNRVLGEAAERIRRVVRPCDSLGRIGDLEFLLVLSNCDAEIATAVAERVVAIVTAEPFDIDGQPVSISASAGVCSLPGGQHATANVLIGTSDVAAYCAQSKGWSRVVTRAIPGSAALHAPS